MALASCFKAMGRFELGEMEDAIECYQLLIRELAQTAGPTMAGMHVELAEQFCCETCGAASEPTPSREHVLYFSAAALRTAKAQAPQASFGRLLKEAFTAENARGCERERCQATSVPRMLLLNDP